MADRTPLYERHDALRAKMFEFGGWEMPLWYTSIVDEHLCVRSNVGVFDASHMGKLLIAGSNCQQIFQKLITRTLTNYPPGRCIYTHLLDDQGRIIDDMIVTNLTKDSLFVVCNASTREKVINWIVSKRSGFDLKDITNDYSCLAVQGPRTVEMLKHLADPELFNLKRYHGALTRLSVEGIAETKSEGYDWCRPISLGMDRFGLPVLMTRTGYTGEDGFEIFARRDDTGFVWDELLKTGKAQSMQPIGLGARDTLRLEKCYLLSGHDFDGSQTPLEADAEFSIDWDHDFLGRSILEKQKDERYSRLIAFESIGKGIPRDGYPLLSETGSRIGKTTSGTMSPSLKIGIGMGYVPAEFSKIGMKIMYTVGTKNIEAKIVEKPFLKK